MGLRAAEPDSENVAAVRPQLPVPIVTYALIGVNAVIFALEMLWGGSETPMTLYRMGANVGRQELLVEPWRVLSSAFLHIGTWHVLMNMWALYVLGSMLERFVGPARTLAIYAASALSGGLLSALVMKQELAAGASGAVWGLMVAWVVLLLRLRRQYGPQAVSASVAQIAQPLIVNFLISMLPGIDKFAHFGGGIMGGLLVLLVPLRPGGNERRWWPWALLGVALMVVSVVMAFVTGQPWDPTAPL
jgi:rhomboid protease GluP